MPKLTETMCTASKYMSDPLKYKIVLPPVLKNTISSKGDGRLNKAVCIQEMSVLMACMKKEEYKPHTCLNELKLFDQCIADHEAEVAKIKEAHKKGVSVEGSNRYPSVQVNKVLRRFPQKPAVFQLFKKSPERRAKNR